MTKYLFSIWLLCLIQICCSDIVINEIFYDAVGSDDSQEWIELYNNGEEDVNLSGWVIQAGGSSFSDIYTFNSIVIRKKSYFLICEFAHPLANILIELGLENGGSATDGVRIYNQDDSYTDTILYDSPNINNLPGDDIDQEPCPASSPGYSLARKCDGLDTNSLADWFSCENPTPGSANKIKKIVTLESCTTDISTSALEVSTIISNLSTLPVDKSQVSIKILFNNELLCSEDLPQILPLTSISHTAILNNEFYQAGELQVELINNADITFVDKSVSMWINWDLPRISLSEIMYYPKTGQPEWVEIKLHNHVIAGDISLQDEAENYSYAQISGQANTYLVVTENKQSLLQAFPECDSLLVVEADSWAKLNNDGDYLTLRVGQVVIDSVRYYQNDTPSGISLEYDEDQDSWHRSFDPMGASPTAMNSPVNNEIEESSNDIIILSKLISPKKGKVFSLSYNYEDRVDNVNLQVFDLRGKHLAVLTIPTSNQYYGQIDWDGYLKGKNLPSGLYPVNIEIKAESGNIIGSKTIIITINR